MSNVYSFQLIEFRVDAPHFVNNICEFLFADEYASTRSFPSDRGRSDKPKMPRQIKGFMNTYVAKHVQDKMPVGDFWRR